MDQKQIHGALKKKTKKTPRLVRKLAGLPCVDAGRVRIHSPLPEGSTWAAFATQPFKSQHEYCTLIKRTGNNNYRARNA